MDDVKEAIRRSAAGLADELETLSKRIHAHPELGFKEVRAAGWLAEFLEAKGFRVERGVGGVETAFRARIETGEAGATGSRRDGPVVAVLCEYDALPGIGHACGHNVIAASGAGAGAALAGVRGRLPAGRVEVIGTPAEEGGGGKIKLIRAGVFEGIDCVMMIHGFDRTLLHQDLLGIVQVDFEWQGKASHAAADPWEGVNALDACIQTFNAIGMLRQQMRPDCRVHGIIRKGGDAPNVIPEHTAASFLVRAPRIDQMWELHRRVVACAEGAARATGTTLTVKQPGEVYEPLRRNQTLLDLFAANMKTVGLAEGAPIPDRLGSSDIGNVSQVLPTIQPMIGIAPTGMAIHTREFAEAAVGPIARSGMLAAAQTMALTAFDLLTDPGRVRAAREEFAARK